MEYQVIYNENLVEMQREVQEAVEKKWEPLGRAFTFEAQSDPTLYFAQTLVKHCKEVE